MKCIHIVYTNQLAAASVNQCALHLTEILNLQPPQRAHTAHIHNKHTGGGAGALRVLTCSHRAPNESPRDCTQRVRKRVVCVIIYFFSNRICAHAAKTGNERRAYTHKHTRHDWPGPNTRSHTWETRAHLLHWKTKHRASTVGANQNTKHLIARAGRTQGATAKHNAKPAQAFSWGCDVKYNTAKKADQRATQMRSPFERGSISEWSVRTSRGRIVSANHAHVDKRCVGVVWSMTLTGCRRCTVVVGLSTPQMRRLWWTKYYSYAVCTHIQYTHLHTSTSWYEAMQPTEPASHAIHLVPSIGGGFTTWSSESKNIVSFDWLECVCVCVLCARVHEQLSMRVLCFVPAKCSPYIRKVHQVQDECGTPRACCKLERYANGNSVHIGIVGYTLSSFGVCFLFRNNMGGEISIGKRDLRVMAKFSSGRIYTVFG